MTTSDYGDGIEAAIRAAQARAAANQFRLKLKHHYQSLQQAQSKRREK